MFTKQQIFMVFVLIMFLGSSLAYALMNVIDIAPQKQQLMFDGPLSNADEAVFLQQNKVVAKYFWSGNCTKCAETNATVDSLFNDFGGSLVIENVDVGQWPDLAEAMDVKDLPVLYLKGYTIDRMDVNITYNDAYDRICELFFEQIEQCYITG